MDKMRRVAIIVPPQGRNDASILAWFDNTNIKCTTDQLAKFKCLQVHKWYITFRFDSLEEATLFKLSFGGELVDD